MTPIAPLIEAFLRETLASQRGASRHTQDFTPRASSCSSRSPPKD